MRLFLATFVFAMAAVASAGDLRFSGVMGQSQPVGDEPLMDSAMRGAATTDDGMLWSFCGSVLCKLSPSEDAPVLQKSFKVYGNGLFRNGNLLYFKSAGHIFSFDPATEKLKKEILLPQGTVAFNYGTGKCQFLALVKNAVWGAEDGKWQKLFDVPVEKGRNYSIGIEPVSGDILVGSEYPTMKIRRFSPDGKEVINGSWPRKGHSSVLTVAGTQAWALFDGAISLPDVWKSEGDVKKVGGEWTFPSTGIAIDAQGRYWLATNQGMLGYDSHGKALDIRMGGMSGIRQLAVTDNGELYATLHDRMIRMPIDATPAKPLTCGGYKFLMCGNYQSRSGGLYWDGQKFIILDEIKKMLWQFDQAHMKWNEKTWLPLTKPNMFKAPKSMAANKKMVFVLDGDNVVYAPVDNLNSFSALSFDHPLIGVKYLASRDDLLFCASVGNVAAFRIGADGKAVQVWDKTSDFTDISGLAAGAQALAVIEKSSGKISLLSFADGKQVAAIAKENIPGGMSPTAVTLLEPWAFVYDDAGKRILRFQYEK